MGLFKQKRKSEIGGLDISSRLSNDEPVDEYAEYREEKRKREEAEAMELAAHNSAQNVDDAELIDEDGFESVTPTEKEEARQEKKIKKELSVKAKVAVEDTAAEPVRTEPKSVLHDEPLFEQGMRTYAPSFDPDEAVDYYDELLKEPEPEREEPKEQPKVEAAEAALDSLEIDESDFDESQVSKASSAAEARTEEKEEEPIPEEEKEETEETSEEPEAAETDIVSAIFSKGYSKIKFARYDRAFVSGKLNKELSGLFKSEDEFDEFVKKVTKDKKGDVVSGYYSGHYYKAVKKSVAVSGATISFSSFPTDKTATMDQFVGFGVATGKKLKAIQKLVKEGRNILIAGPKQSGKTTILNYILSGCNDEESLMIAIDRAGELSAEGMLYEVADGESQSDLLKDAIGQEASLIVLGEISKDGIGAFLDAMRGGIQCITTLSVEKTGVVDMVNALSEMSGSDASKIKEDLLSGKTALIVMNRPEKGISTLKGIYELEEDREKSSGSGKYISLKEVVAE